MRDSAWTKERVELLAKLAEQGLSARKIAERFGGVVTRNAVIGKIHRLKLVHNSSQAGRRSTKGVSAARASKQPESTKTTPVYRVGRPSQPPSAALVRDPNGLPFCEIYVAPEKRKGIVDLEPGDCRWPIGDPLHASFHFCGREKAQGLSYCAHHAQVAYVPFEPKRGLRERGTGVNRSVQTAPPTPVSTANDNAFKPDLEAEEELV